MTAWQMVKQNVDKVGSSVDPGMWKFIIVERGGRENSKLDFILLEVGHTLTYTNTKKVVVLVHGN